MNSVPILVSFLVAMMLTSLPLPETAIIYRPDWLILVLIYWCMAIPERIGIFTGWMLGLLLDVMYGSLLGQNAMAFVHHCLPGKYPAFTCADVPSVAAVGYGVFAGYSAPGNKRMDQRYCRTVFCHLDILDTCADKCPGMAIYIYCVARHQASNQQ